MTKTQIILKMANEKRDRPICRFKQFLKYATDDQVLAILNKMVKRGLIKYQIIGRKVKLTNLVGV